MFAAASVSTLNYATGIAAGVALVIALFKLLAYQSENRRKANSERAPISTNLLRPAGHSLSARIADLDEKLTIQMMETLAAGACFGLCLTGLYPVIAGLALGRFTISELWAHKDSSIFLVATLLTIAILGWLIRSFSHVQKRQCEIRNGHFGLRGEQAVAEALASPALAAAGFTIFHDIPGDGPWNIDHIVIGPPGIIVLETKTCAKRKAKWDQPEHEVLYDGRVLRFPWRVEYEAVHQALTNAGWLKKHLAQMAILPLDLPIIPVLVIPGWNVISKGNYPVKAMPESYLRDTFLPTLKRAFTSDQLQPIIRLLNQRCRTLEF